MQLRGLVMPNTHPRDGFVYLNLKVLYKLRGRPFDILGGGGGGGGGGLGYFPKKNPVSGFERKK